MVPHLLPGLPEWRWHHSCQEEQDRKTQTRALASSAALHPGALSFQANNGSCLPHNCRVDIEASQEADLLERHKINPVKSNLASLTSRGRKNVTWVLDRVTCVIPSSKCWLSLFSSYTFTYTYILILLSYCHFPLLAGLGWDAALLTGSREGR